MATWTKLVTTANLTDITTVGTVGTGTWNGSVIASDYLDSDTAHLSTAQTFSGAKTFGEDVRVATDKTILLDPNSGNIEWLSEGGTRRGQIVADGNGIHYQTGQSPTRIFSLPVAGTSLRMAGSSDIIWETDNSGDIGATGATRPRDLNLARNAIIAGTVTSGNVEINGTGILTIDSPTSVNLYLDRSGADKHGSAVFQTAGSTNWAAGLTDSDSSGYDGSEFYIGQTTGASSAPALSIDTSNNAVFAGTVSWTGGDSGESNTAYDWGNHASAGYSTLAIGTTSSTAARGDRGVTAYDHSQVSGGVHATGTVTSVATAGTVSGLTLTGGTITGAGTITLGGTLALGSLNTTGSSGTFTSTSQDSQFNSIGVGVAASTTAGEGRFTHEVTAYYSSDVALKTNIKPISNPLEKVLSLGGYNFDWKDKVLKDRGGEDGFFVRKNDVGILAHEIEQVIPEIVVTRSDGTKAVKYEKIIPLLIESVKEIFRLQDKWNERIEDLENANLS